MKSDPMLVAIILGTNVARVNNVAKCHRWITLSIMKPIIKIVQPHRSSAIARHLRHIRHGVNHCSILHLLAFYVVLLWHVHLISQP